MTKKTLFLTVAAIAVLSLSSMAIAGPGYGRGGGGCPGFGAGINQPALTPEQQTQAQAIFEAHQKRMIPIAETLRAKNALLEAELAQVKPNSNKIDALAIEVGKLRTQMFQERVELRKQLAEAGIPQFGRGMGRGHGYGHGRGMMGQGGMGRGMGPGAGQGFCPGGGPYGG